MTRTDPTLFLRRVLGLDAMASGATGLLMAFAADPLETYLGLDATFTQPAGLFLIAYALGVAALALRPRPPRPLVLAVIAINVLWAVESGLTLALGWLEPNALGIAFVIAQAAVVAGFAALQAWALRPAAATA